MQAHPVMTLDTIDDALLFFFNVLPVSYWIWSVFIGMQRPINKILVFTEPISASMA